MKQALLTSDLLGACSGALHRALGIHKGPIMTEADRTELYRLPPVIHNPPPATHGLATRRFQGIPSLAAAPNDRLWAIWYAGKTPAEDHNNYVVITTSGDGGGAWVERLVIDPDGEGPVRAFDPQLWMDPTGRLWAFWAQAIGHQGTVAGVWAMTNADPEADDADWSAPRRLTDGIMMGKPIVLSTGEWLLPVSTWRDTDNSARVVVSDDQGQTWDLRGACDVPKDLRQYDEHMVVEKRDGALWMLIRTNQGIGESQSSDRGRTWSPFRASPIQHTSSRFFIHRLASGNLLLVKHGPIHEITGRSHLTAFTSTDDGASWSNGLLLDERAGVSYPDGQQGKDGTIYIIYDRSRTGEGEILMSRFTEADVNAGGGDRSSAEMRHVVSRFPARSPDTVK